jgi:hypothetical protein
VLFSLLLSISRALAADTVLTWPADGKDAMLRFSIGKLRQVSSNAGQTDYLGDAIAENLSVKTIPSASFYVYLLDKNGKRVGEGYLEVTNLPGGQKVKIPVTAHAMSSFARMELQPQHLPSDEPMKVKMHINSVPPGATIKLDSQDSGITPQVLPIAPGKHTMEFSKEGYAPASTPVEVAANSMPGSVDIDLNPLTVDTVVLRDGTAVLGNVTAVTDTAVNLTVKGKSTVLPRSRVARVVFGQRKSSASTTKAARTKK